MIRSKRKNRITKQGNHFTKKWFPCFIFFVCVRKGRKTKNTIKNKGSQNKDSFKRNQETIFWFFVLIFWNQDLVNSFLELFLAFKIGRETFLNWGFFCFLSVFWKSEKVNDFMPFSHCCLICFVYSLRIIRLIQIKIVPLQGKNYILWQIVK